MNINITGRHINISDRLKDYSEKKIKKLEKYFHQLMDAHLIMYVEKLDHGAEIIINGDGIQFHGREKAADLYSSIDLLIEKMEKQIVKFKEKHSSHKASSPNDGVPFELETSMGMRINLVQVSNKPIDKIEAYLQMKVDKKDFILFKKGIPKVESDFDYSNKNYAVIYRGAQGIKMIKIPYENMKEHKFDFDNFVEYDLNVLNESPANPNIEFKKCNQCTVKKLTIDEAVSDIESSRDAFLAFFNTESQYFNIIYKNGKDYNIMVPAF